MPAAVYVCVHVYVHVYVAVSLFLTLLLSQSVTSQSLSLHVCVHKQHVLVHTVCLWPSHAYTSSLRPPTLEVQGPMLGRYHLWQLCWLNKFK
jgi:hypothetical protein